MPEWNCLSGLWGKLVIGLLLARLKELFKSKGFSYNYTRAMDNGSVRFPATQHLILF